MTVAAGGQGLVGASRLRNSVDHRHRSLATAPTYEVLPSIGRRGHLAKCVSPSLPRWGGSCLSSSPASYPWRSGDHPRMDGHGGSATWLLTQTRAARRDVAGEWAGLGRHRLAGLGRVRASRPWHGMGPTGASGTPSPLVRKEKDNPAGICRGGIHANGTAGGTFLVLSPS